MARYCGTCGRLKTDRRTADGIERSEHYQVVAGGPVLCPLEFTVVNQQTGERVGVDPWTLPTGFQRTRQNLAAWVHPDRAS